jgi:hypothetical protein
MERWGAIGYWRLLPVLPAEGVREGEGEGGARGSSWAFSFARWELCVCQSGHGSLKKTRLSR